MNPKKNLILLLVLLLAGGAYYLYDVKWADEKKAEEERKAKVLKGIDSKRLIRVSLEREKEPYQIIRTEKGWRFVKPVDAAMDEDQQEGILKTASSLKPSKKVGNVSDVSEFGLDKPRMTLTFGLKDEKDVVIRLGDRTPTREFLYASLEKNGPVFTVKLSDVERFNKPVFDLRDRSVVPIEPEKAQKIVIEPQGQTSFTVVRKSEDTWEMIAPVKDKADSTDSEGVVSALKFKKVKRFVEENPKDLSKYGLKEPGYVVRIFTDKEGKSGDGLLIGTSTTEEATDRRGRKTMQVLYYARRISGGPVMLVGNEVIKELPREVFKLRSKNIIDYDVDHITRLKIESPAEVLDIKRLGKREWDLRSTKPGGKAVKLEGSHKHIDDVLWDVKWSNSVEYVDEPGGDLSKYGAAGGKWPNRVTLWIKKKKDGPEVKKIISLGPLNDEERAYGRLGGVNKLFAIAKKDFAKILRSGFYLSDRRLVKFKEEEDIVQVKLKFPSGGEAVLKRKGDDWAFEKPAGKKVNPSPVNDILRMLKELEYQEEAKKGDAYDFEKYLVRVELQHKNGKKLGPVIFAGGGTKKSQFVRRGDSSKVLRVEKTDVGPNIPKSVESLIKKKKKDEA
ncbi:MAG: DUF4340 domain-containing protein [bacterium]